MHSPVMTILVFVWSYQLSLAILCYAQVVFKNAVVNYSMVQKWPYSAGPWSLLSSPFVSHWTYDHLVNISLDQSFMHYNDLYSTTSRGLLRSAPTPARANNTLFQTEGPSTEKQKHDSAWWSCCGQRELEGDLAQTSYKLINWLIHIFYEREMYTIYSLQYWNGDFHDVFLFKEPWITISSRICSLTATETQDVLVVSHYTMHRIYSGFWAFGIIKLGALDKAEL